MRPNPIFAIAAVSLVALALIATPHALAQDIDGDGVPDEMDLCPGADGPDGDSDGTPSGCDCDDDDDTRGFGVADICDGIDNDCDGRPDMHTAFDVGGGQIISRVTSGDAANPSSRAFTARSNRGIYTEIGPGSSTREVYLRAPIELMDVVGPRIVHTRFSRRHRFGDHDFTVALSDGTRVVAAALNNSVSSFYSPAAYLASDAGGALTGTTLERETNRIDEGTTTDAVTYIVTFRFEADRVVIDFATGGGRQRIEIPVDGETRLDPAADWDVLLVGDSRAESYDLFGLSVFQDVPAAGGGVDADGDGFIAMCDCDDTNALAFPGSVDVCDGIDNDCGGDGDGVTLMDVRGDELVANFLRTTASNPSNLPLVVEDDLLTARRFSADHRVFYRQALDRLVTSSDPRFISSVVESRVHVEITFDAEDGPAQGAHIGFTDGNDVVAVDATHVSGLPNSVFVRRGTLGETNVTDLITSGGRITSPRDATFEFDFLLSSGLMQIQHAGRTINTSARLDFNLPIQLVLFESDDVFDPRLPNVRIKRLVLTQETVDDDGDGICNRLDRCSGADGIDGDGDGVGAACDCDDSDPRNFPGSLEACDGVAQSCGAVDERVFLDVDGNGLAQLISSGRATNPSREPLRGGATTTFDGDANDILFRFPLEDFNPNIPLVIDTSSVPSGTFGLVGLFPQIYLSDGIQAVGYEPSALRFPPGLTHLVASFPAQDDGRRLIPDRTGVSGVGGHSGADALPVGPIRVTIQRVAGEAVITFESNDLTSVMAVPWTLIPGRPVSLVLAHPRTASSAIFRSMRVAQGLPDDDGDSVCNLVDRCAGFDDRVDGDLDSVPDFCDVCFGVDGPDLDADGYPAGCDCNDSNPDIHPGAIDICDRVDQDCDGIVDRRSGLAARGIELLTQIGRGLASNPSGRELIALRGGEAVQVRGGGSSDEEIFYRSPIALLAARGEVQRFTVNLDRQPLPGDHDLSLVVSDGTRVFGVRLSDEDGVGRRTLAAPVYGDDGGRRIEGFAAGEGTALDDSPPYRFDFVFDAAGPRIEVTAADGGSATLVLDADVLGGLDTESLELLLVAGGPEETHVIRSLSVTQQLADADGDTVCDAADRCDGVDDTGADTDGDSFPDACDRCSGGDDLVDTDMDGIPNACDSCEDEDDLMDRDGDGIPDACDICPDDAANDSDGDMVCDRSDSCLPGDDRIDTDSDGIPDACDVCPDDDAGDSDEDGTCDAADVCQGNDLTGDLDGDGFCADRDCDDTRAMVFPDATEICDGFDSNCSGAIPLSELDVDGDGTIDCLEEPPADGGCSATRGSTSFTGATLLLAFLLLCRRRRRGA